MADFNNANAGKSDTCILVLGAGKSATVLIDYLLRESVAEHWQVVVADADPAAAREKIGGHPSGRAVQLAVQDEQARTALIAASTLVISLLPPSLHYLVALSCVATGKNLLTASYADEQIRQLEGAIKAKGLLFLCEMGLDPGIDHMSAMQLIDRLKTSGASIGSFVSHCGGLVAPEYDDNPWQYKISWNPRNVVMAGKAGAVYREHSQTIRLPYASLFEDNRILDFPGLGKLAWYPNRDSLSYLELYGLPDVDTFIRTTLRYPSFCSGWKKLVLQGLTNDQLQIDTDGLSLQQFFRSYFPDAARISNDNLFYKQLLFLGLEDSGTRINKGRCSPMDALQFALENKLVLGKDDRDMVLMLHEINYTQEGQQFELRSRLLVKGDNQVRTAMAMTVGLPLGIAAKLILQHRIGATGLQLPLTKEIYQPVLEELSRQGISFTETTTLQIS